MCDVFIYLRHCLHCARAFLFSSKNIITRETIAFIPYETESLVRNIFPDTCWRNLGSIDRGCFCENESPSGLSPPPWVFDHAHGLCCNENVRDCTVDAREMRENDAKSFLIEMKYPALYSTADVGLLSSGVFTEHEQWLDPENILSVSLARPRCVWITCVVRAGKYADAPEGRIFENEGREPDYLVVRATRVRAAKNGRSIYGELTGWLTPRIRHPIYRVSSLIVFFFFF